MKTRNTKYSIFVVLFTLCLSPRAAEMNARVWEPVEWTFDNDSYAGNPYDIVAKATFKHEQTEEEITTEIYYDGDHAWKLRFTATLPGQWRFVTESGDPELNGHTGEAKIAPNPGAAGFLTNYGGKWGKLGIEEAFVPQYVMYADIGALREDPGRIDSDIQEFFVEHGFNGLHTFVLCRWFNFERTRWSEITDPDPNPDPRTFEVLERLIGKVHAVGGVVHLWAWGDEQRRMTPMKWGLNGTVDRRLQRYICARLGPLPGWSMGYGFDLQEWAGDEDLQKWRDTMHEHLGWFHFLGGRAPDLTQICDGLDYSSYQQHRPDYQTYVKAIEQYPAKPTFLEDRFRVRVDVYPNKDYDFDMTRRGLWHSTMAGGAANIWGNLLDPRPDDMSHPYPNKHQILTWSRFWKERFKREMIRENRLTDGVCLTAPGRLAVFYKEDTDTIEMNLSGMPGPFRAVAVDTKESYEEIDLGALGHSKLTAELPRRSDWAVAISVTEVKAGN